MSFSGLRGAAFDGEKNGRLYLTTHRMVFNNKGTKDEMKSFSFPFVALRNVELEQPVFGANYIKGKVLAQPNGGFEGEAKFKLRFKSGGAIGKFIFIVQSRYDQQSFSMYVLMYILVIHLLTF